MRVVQLIDSLAPGGAERSLVELVPHLSALGARVEFLLLHDRPGLADEARGAGAPVTVVGGVGRAAWLTNATRFLRFAQPDIVNTTLFDADVIGRLAARASGVICVSTLVNTPYGREHREEPGLRRFGVRAAQLADMGTARVTRRFRAVSESVKAAYVERIRIAPSLVDVIPEGRDPRRLGTRDPDRRTAARRSLGIFGTEPVLLAVGRQEPQKGFDVLVRALPLVRHFAPDAVVLIAGREGRSSPELGRLVHEAGLGRAVRFLGHREDVYELMCAADVLVLPSLREGIPGVVQEAMALETPIVASDIGPVRDALGGGRLGALFRPGQPADLAGSVKWVLDSQDAALVRVREARRFFLQEFDISVVATRVLRFYERALQGTGTSLR